MRALLFAILAVAIGWSGYWFWGARATDQQMLAWFDAREAEGWVVNYTELNTAGFPNRFDTTLTDIELADPETGLAWQAPQFQILRLSYQPNHLIAVWPDSQIIATPEQHFTLGTSDMRGSLLVTDAQALRLERATITADGLTLSSSSGWSAAAAHMQLALRQAPALGNSYDIAVNLTDLVLPDAWIASVPQAFGGDKLGQTDLMAQVTFDAPWDLAALDTARPQPIAIEISQARTRWGELTLQAVGKLTADENGQAEGQLSVKATNWEPMLSFAADSGALPRELVPVMSTGLNFLARLSGNPNSVEADLVFSAGRMSLGGVIPLGAAPNLRLR